jgi:hypothetical protein
MKWQPIETAPKDGRQILCAYRFHPDYDVLRWDSEYGDWSTNGGESFNPAWWMPLPEPPNE